MTPAHSKYHKYIIFEFWKSGVYRNEDTGWHSYAVALADVMKIAGYVFSLFILSQNQYVTVLFTHCKYFLEIVEAAKIVKPPEPDSSMPLFDVLIIFCLNVPNPTLSSEDNGGWWPFPILSVLWAERIPEFSPKLCVSRFLFVFHSEPSDSGSSWKPPSHQDFCLLLKCSLLVLILRTVASSGTCFQPPTASGPHICQLEVRTSMWSLSVFILLFWELGESIWVPAPCYRTARSFANAIVSEQVYREYLCVPSACRSPPSAAPLRSWEQWPEKSLTGGLGYSGTEWPSQLIWPIVFAKKLEFQL